MKKILQLSLAVLFTFSLLSVGYGYADAHLVRQVEISANFASFDHVDELFKDSDLVVKATATDKSANILNRHHGYTDGYTLTDIKIDKVIKGDQKLQNTIYQVAEPTYVVDNGISPGTTRFSYEEYTPIQSGATYILFIKESSGKNWVNALYQGKYNIDEKDRAEIHR